MQHNNNNNNNNNNKNYYYCYFLLQVEWWVTGPSPQEPYRQEKVFTTTQNMNMPIKFCSEACFFILFYIFQLEVLQ